MKLPHRFTPLAKPEPLKILHPVTGMPLGRNEVAQHQSSYVEGEARSLINQPLPHPIVPERLHSIETEAGEGLVPDIRNGYWERFKDFAGAEGVSLACSVAGTGAVAMATQDPMMILLSGPIIEKFGFVGWEIMKEAWNPSSDLTYGGRINKMMYGFLNNLKTDIIFHDMLSYMPLMGLGMYLFPDMSPALISGVAFSVGVLMAPKWEQMAGEVLHKFIKVMADRRELDVETYYEARYVLNESSEPVEIFENMAKQFDLKQGAENVYEDIYFENNIPQWSEREVVARQRRIFDMTGQVQYHNNFEVFATQPKAVSVGEYTVFEVRKEKAYIPLTEPDAAEKAFGKAIYKRITQSPSDPIAFRRRTAYNDKVRITLDIVYVTESEAYYVIEFKGYENSRSDLYELILHFKNKYGSQATIRSKNEIITHLRNL